MFTYLLRRTLIGAITLLMITFVIYGLIRAMPGDALTVEIGNMDPQKEINRANIERLRKLYGLDTNWVVGYGNWLANAVRFDLGPSISRKQPVVRLIRERIGPTLTISLTSLFLAYVLSIPLGLRATVRSGSIEERTTSTLLYMLYSLPAFVAALFLQILLAVKLGWLPLMGLHSVHYEDLSPWRQAWDSFQHAFMPIACFTYGSLAYDTRFIKSNMEEVIRQDYIRTARSKGVSPLRVVCVHAFRNTMIPFVTMLGLSLPALLSGAVILEQIFSWPGMGNLFFESLGQRDVSTIMGLTLVFSVMTLAGQLLADILYVIVDPRISYS